jgi:hypothetical protein
MTLVSDIILIRTDTTLDLSPKAEKGTLVDGHLPPSYTPSPSLLLTNAYGANSQQSLTRTLTTSGKVKEELRFLFVKFSVSTNSSSIRERRTQRMCSKRLIPDLFFPTIFKTPSQSGADAVARETKTNQSLKNGTLARQ